MRLSRDEWLTGVLGYDVFRLEDPGVLMDGGAQAVVERLEQSPDALCYTKIETCEVGSVQTLSRIGFAVVDVNMTFAAQPAVLAAAAPRRGVEIATADPGQRDDVLRIAGSCFKYSRFHLDPSLTNAAHHVKSEWMASYFDGRRGDQLLVASVDGQVAGFLAALKSEHAGRPAAVIDLIGVATDRQRLGVGRALVRHFGACHAACDRVVVGTQAANVPSIQFYEGLGFRLIGSTYVPHRRTGGLHT